MLSNNDGSDKQLLCIERQNLKWTPFNDKKCKVIAFGSQNYKPTYKLGEAVMDSVDTATYLPVIMQSNLKFNQHMKFKKDKAQKTLAAIKHILKQAPKECRLLTYTSLCRPILEYADTVWDSTLANKVEPLKMLQRTRECHGSVL